MACPGWSQWEPPLPVAAPRPPQTDLQTSEAPFMTVPTAVWNAHHLHHSLFTHSPILKISVVPLFRVIVASIFWDLCACCADRGLRCWPPSLHEFTLCFSHFPFLRYRVSQFGNGEKLPLAQGPVVMLVLAQVKLRSFLEILQTFSKGYLSVAVGVS